jgi:hypothetical protein
MKEEDVRIVIVETYSSAAQAEAVAEAAGAQVIVLPDHVRGRAEADSYQNLFRANIHKLIEAAQAAGIAPHPPEGSNESGQTDDDGQDGSRAD